METRLIVALASFVLSFAAYGKQDTCYRLTRIEGDDQVSIRDLNDKGELVGSLEFAFKAFLWRDGQFFDLPPPLDSQSIATAINRRSDIVGSFSDRIIWLRRDGLVTEIPGVAGAIGTGPVDINNRRQILLVSATESFEWRAHIWKRGEVTTLELLPGTSSAIPAEINDRGVAVGRVGPESTYVPVMWDADGAVMPLPLLEGATVGRATDINNKGQVLITALFGNPIGSIERSYIWDEGEITVLGLLNPDARSAVAEAMNGRGVAVGVTTFDFRNTATLWRRGRPVALGTLICADDPRPPDLQLTQAFEINNRGQIIAFGIDEVDAAYYFLDPRRP